MLPSVSDLLSKTIAVYRKNTAYFLRFMAIFFVIIFLLGLAQDAIFSSSLIPIPGLAFIVYLVSAIMIGIATLWLNLGLMVASKHALDEQPLLPFKTVMQQVWPFVPAAAIAAVLSGILVLVGGLLFVIPGLMFAVWFSFASHEVVFFNAAAIPALQESKRLVVGRWFAVAWRLFAPSFILAFIASILEVLVLAPFSWPHLLDIPYNLPALITNSLVIAILYSIIFPMITMASVMLFFALKKESTPSTPEPVNPETTA